MADKMSRNISSSNDLPSYPNLSSTNTDLIFAMLCLSSQPSFTIFIAFTITKIFLLLPLCILILVHRFQQWWQNHTASSATTVTHSDSFTYHIVIVELIGFFGCILCCLGIYRENFNIVLAASVSIAFTWYGEMCFHVLTCVERYLAVIHPITYLSLRNERGIRIRNISIGCVWLFSLAPASLTTKGYLFLDWCLLILSLIIISFFSLSVLHVLIHPGPGEQGRKKARTDQSKKRAVYTIVAILAVLILRFAWNLVWTVMNDSRELSNCMITTLVLWFSLPSSLVLPLMFLHKTGKLLCSM